jgi:hypothetical protein
MVREPFVGSKVGRNCIALAAEAVIGSVGSIKDDCTPKKLVGERINTPL